MLCKGVENQEGWITELLEGRTVKKNNSSLCNEIFGDVSRRERRTTYYKMLGKLKVVDRARGRENHSKIK